MGNTIAYKKNKPTIRKTGYNTEVKDTKLKVSPSEVVYQWNTSTTVDQIVIDNADNSDSIIESSAESSVRV